jgi:hypothetical protein
MVNTDYVEPILFANKNNESERKQDILGKDCLQLLACKYYEGDRLEQ